MPAKRNKVIRTVYVDPKTWEEAKRAVEVNGTNISQAVNKFLKDYVRATIAYQQMPESMRKWKPRFVDANKTYVPISNRGQYDKPINPEFCTHISRKKTAFGIWCEGCATMVEPIGVDEVFGG